MTQHRRDKRTKPASDPHADRESRQYEQPVASREFLLSLLAAEKAPMNYEALVESLGYDDDESRLEGLRRRLLAMQRDGQLIQNRKGGYVPVDDDALVAGRISAHPDGFGFLIADDGDSDVYLGAREMRTVLHGDRVVVAVTGLDRRGRREGRIVDIVERANTTLVGRVAIEHGVILVSPDNKRLTQDLVVTQDGQGGARHGDIVVAEITEQPTRRHPPVGQIVEVLGEHMDAGMEIDVALRSRDIPSEWPDAVNEEMVGFADVVDEADKTGRKDVRRLPLVTIDGADARDFDDAVYCEPMEKGWRLLVAIADVAHYVVPGTALDDEAISRGTSVYFPGRVVPMLPEAISNGLCSINPDVDRLCMLCEMTLDAKGSLKKARFFNGLMRSHARLTYDEVNEMLTERKSPLRKHHALIFPHLVNLHKLYGLLAKARRKRGAIEFDSTETRIVFDDNRKISELVPVVRNDAHRLIEECMILANIAAAAFMEKHEIPALYRVHHGPKADRLEDLRGFLALHGLELGGGENPSALDYAALARTIEARQDRSVIQTVMLRSMQQAVYQPRNEGHFGLALSHYAHFTSPIRRYPDLLVHRAIKHVLTREGVDRYRYTRERMQSLGESCSMTERRAEEASRDVVSWLKCEYMQDHIGSEFDGVVAAVTSFGLFVELTDFHVEGLIHITNLARDYYRFEKEAQRLVGERSGRVFRLGDAIRVRVDGVNLEERKIDFGHLDTGSSRKAQAPAAEKGSLASVVDPEEARRAKRKRAKQRKRDARREERKANAAVASPGKQAVPVDESPGLPGADAEGALAPVARSSTSQEPAASQIAVDEPAAAPAPLDDKASVDKTAVKKAVTGKAASKRATAKKVTAKTATAKKAAAKKAAAKKAAVKKAAAKKAAAKKAASKKAAAKKAAAKKAAAKKAAATKAAAKKAAAKKAAAKKAGSKKKAVSRKTVSKKAATGTPSKGRDASSDDNA